VSIAVVITTIQAPTRGVLAIAEGMASGDGELILIGDRKTPVEFGCEGSFALSVKDQMALPFATAQAVPENSYTRKMLGYLVAIDRGHEWIRETDDDNIPNSRFFDPVPNEVMVRVPANRGWVNPYSFFTDRFVWPRGFPLDALHDHYQLEDVEKRLVRQPFVLQGLADGDPDVDAIYRLTASDTDLIAFESKDPLLIPAGSRAPFNSQVTTWPKALFPLMYLPATCSFRMTDIWRSYVAQHLMGFQQAHVIFTSPTVFQERNEHDLMRDFRDEVEGYLGYRTFAQTLDSIVGLEQSNLSEGLRISYRHLVDAGFFQESELTILEAWLADIAELGLGSF
jgi:hypothetical protein